MLVFGRMSVWVVGPIFFALVIGKWLDDRYHTTPFLFLVLTGVAFVISITGLIKESRKYLKNIPPVANKDDQKENKK